MELKDVLLAYLLRTYTNGEVTISEETIIDLPAFCITAEKNYTHNTIIFKLKEGYHVNSTTNSNTSN